MSKPYASGTPHTNLITAASIGQIVSEQLSGGQSGVLYGRTSRGMFIKSDSRWLIFLSMENYRGPLTINLDNNKDLLADPIVNQPVELSPGRIHFPDADLMITVEGAEIWGLPPIPSRPLDCEKRFKRLLEFGKQAIEYKKTASLAPLLPAILGFSSDAPPIQEIPEYQADILHWCENKHNRPQAEELIGLLGSGSGLTPSGDDVVLGYLLALNRCAESLFPSGDLSQINSQVVAAAYERTTTLSANLIECAAHGFANERLINALDWLMGSNHLQAPNPKILLSWGSSSGVDVFIGFVLALSGKT
jgi:hypothetical protein